MKQLLLFLLLLSSPAFSGEKPEIILDSVHKINTVKVWLWPMFQLTPTAPPEIHMKDMGCFYTTQDPQLITRLVDLLIKADIRKLKPSEHPRAENIMGVIYLEISDKDRIELKFGHEPPDLEKIRGELIRFHSKTPINADLELTNSLYTWVKKVRNPINDTVENNCEDFVDFPD